MSEVTIKFILLCKRQHSLGNIELGEMFDTVDGIIRMAVQFFKLAGKQPN